MERLNAAQPRLADYLRPLKARKWMILLAVVLATGATYAYFAHKPNVYTASTDVYVIDPGDPVTGVPNPQATDRQVADQAGLVDSRSTAAAVVEKIGYPGSASDLLNHVAITSRPGEDFVEFTAHGSSAGQAAAIANGFGNEFVSLVNGAENSRIASALRLSQAQLAALGTGVPAQLSRADLIAQIDRLKLALADPQKISQMVQAALPPRSPSSPKPVPDALFALIVSLVLAIGLAYAMERFDRRLKNPEEMETAYSAPLLAVLPHTDDPVATRDGQPTLGADFREAFRILRTNIELAAVDSPPRTIVVSSAVPGEGKSTVVRNLALAFREAGKRVAVIDLDLRHPALARPFGVAEGPGITEVMRREAVLGDVTLRIAVRLTVLEEVVRAYPENGSPANGTNGHRVIPLPHPKLSLILSGARPANPPALLASQRLIEVLDELRAQYDVVLIDTAPVLAVTDTIPLLRYADALVVVGRLSVSTRDTARRLLELLERVPGVNTLGVVANDLASSEAESYGYGYGSSYKRYREDPALTVERAVKPKAPA